MSKYTRAAVFGAVCGIVAVAALSIAVFFTGMTFGQRCAALGFTGDELDQCVNRLASGGDA